MDGKGTASGYMTSSGSTYTFVMTGQQDSTSTVVNFTITIEFKSTSVTIPDAVRG